MTKRSMKKQTNRDNPDLSLVCTYAVTVDLVIFTVVDRSLKVLLVKRGIPPFKGEWAIPGGFVREGESLEQCARRELLEETSVENIYLEQLYSFGDPDRDPRMRVITVAYFALIASDAHRISARTDAIDVDWFAVDERPRLAFDHDRIVDYAVERLRYKLDYTTAGFQLLPERFTLTELQTVYEIILGRSLDKRNFRKKILSLGILLDTGDTKMDGVHRPARLYKYSETRFMNLRDKGIIFPF